MSRRILRHFALLAVVALLPARSSAQQLSVGGNLGWMFDTEVDRLSIGADVRYALKDQRWALNPRFTCFLWSEGSSGWQLDGNVLYRFPVGASEKVEPYAGIGLGLVSTSFDSGTSGKVTDTVVGTNIISGFSLKTASKLKPWLHLQYTAAIDFGNTFIGFVGASYPLGK